MALSNHYLDRCQHNMDSTARDCGVSALGDKGTVVSMLGEDLPATLLNVSQWFSAWLSPYTSGAIFDGMPDHRDRLLQLLQATLRSSFNRVAAEALREQLEQLVVDDNEADLQATSSLISAQQVSRAQH